MSQEASDILNSASLLNRSLYQQRIADTAEAQSEQYKPTIYTSFDAELGLGRLQDFCGNISYGNAQTNGAVGIGENIRLRRGGVIAGYDAMPRILHSAASTKINSSASDRLRILFSVYEDGKTNFYIGGDRRKPKLIHSLESQVTNLSGAISNNKKPDDYVAAIRYSGNELNVFSLDTYSFSNPNLLFLGYDTWQTYELYRRDSYGAPIFLSLGYYYPIVEIFNAGIIDNNLIVNNSGFAETLVAFYTVNGFGIADAPIVTSISGSDGRGNSYTFNQEVTPAALISGELANLKAKIHRSIEGDFLVKKWQDAYILERCDYTSDLEFNSFFPSEYSKFTYEGEKSYFLHKGDATQQLNSDETIVISCNLISETSQSITVKAINSFFSFANNFYRLHTEDYFATLGGHPVLFAHRISAKKFKVFKGNISTASFNQNSELLISIAIESVTTVGYASFSNKLLSDNGSWLAYWFVSIGQSLPYLYSTYYHQEVLFQDSILCSPLGRSLKAYEYNPLVPPGINEIVDLPSTPEIFSQDNLVRNKIYRIQYTRGESYPDNTNEVRFIEEWDIVQGLIKYSGRVKKISPFPSKKSGATVIAMTYHP